MISLPVSRPAKIRRRCCAVASAAASIQVRAAAELELRRRRALQDAPRASQWLSDRGVYVNRDTGRPYAPHHEDERRFVSGDTPRYALARGGEGGGKSVAGIIKGLERLRRGMSGIMVSPDLPHFKRSLWPEFKRWCPWSEVVPSQRYRGGFDWEPHDPFMLAFKNGATLLCGGIENPGSWEGPNVHFAHLDEARHKKEPDALKVLAGRIRLPGPNGEPPQLYLTTTPRKHWLYDYFGPLREHDPQAVFKASALEVILRTADNIDHLDPAYVAERGAVLNEAERAVILDAEWLDIDDIDRFLPTILWWDACREDLPLLDARTPLVCALDGAKSDDHCALVAVSVHPTRQGALAVRHVRVWEPVSGRHDLGAIEREIRQFCATWNVVLLAYDPYQLHQMAGRLADDGVVLTQEFGQTTERLLADKALLDRITQRGIAHDGDETLRQHLANADRKLTDDRKLRMVKRSQALKIDAAVTLSMACAAMAELGTIGTDRALVGGPRPALPEPARAVTRPQGGRAPSLPLTHRLPGEIR